MRRTNALFGGSPWRRTGAALTAGLAAFGAFFAAYLSERNSQEARLAAELHLLSSSFAAKLETHVQTRLEAGRLLVESLIEDDAAISEEFPTRTAIMHDLFGDFQALNWVSAEGVIEIVTPLEGNGAVMGLDVTGLPMPAQTLAAAAESGQTQLSPPLELAQGGTGFVAYLPLIEAGEPKGYLNIVFRAGPLMASALGTLQEERYSYRVYDGMEMLYGSGTEDPDSAISETVLPAANRSWRFQVAATPQHIQALASPVDEILLVFGLFAGGLTAALAHLLLQRQAALRDSRAMFHDFATSSSDWFWEMDADLRLVSFTEGLEEVMGLAPKDLIGRSRDELRVPHNDDEAWEMHLTDLAARRPFRDVQYATPVGNRIKWVRVSGVPQFDESGRFLGYRGSATDITDLVRSQTEAAEANARLAATVENLDELFSLWDADDRLVFGNRKFRTLAADVPDVSAPGTSFEAYLRGCLDAGHMADQTIDRDAYIAKSLARRHTARAEVIEVERSDGVILLLREQKLADGGVVTIGLDVTRQRANEAALRASEKRLALAVQQVSIWDWNLEADTLYLSPAFRKTLGYGEEEFEEIKANSVASLIHPDDISDYRARLKAHLGNPDTAFRSQHRFLTKSGEYRWFLAVGQVTRDGPDGAMRSTGLLTDVTERVALEEQLQHAQKMKAIGNLTGGVAHDFNNLLAVILGNLELIRETERRPETLEFADAGIAAAQRGAELVRNMLSFARKARLEPRALDLNRVVAETQTWCDRVLAKTITLEARLESALWTVEADPNLLQNALLNLVLNAQDAMPEGGALLITTENQRITAGQRDIDGVEIAPGRYVTLEVQDSGSGIPDGDLKTVFEPFFTTKPPGSGSGLGLSMVHGFVKQSGGHVQVTSTSGNGTTVTLLFPIQTAVDTPISNAAPSKAPPPVETAGRILVAEDEPAVLKILTTTLDRAGYEVHAAASGDDALALWKDSGRFDLLITDIVMPGTLQGGALALALREHAPDLPVIFVSGYAPDSHGPSGDAVLHGKPGDVRLMKPVSKIDLLTAVAQAISGTQRETVKRTGTDF